MLKQNLRKMKLRVTMKGIMKKIEEKISMVMRNRRMMIMMMTKNL